MDLVHRGTVATCFGGTTARGFGCARTRAFESSLGMLLKSAPLETTTLSAIANRSRLESFSEERGGWLWDTIEEGLGTYLYGFSRNRMRTNPRLYGIRTKEYPNAIGYCANIHRKGVEGQGMRVGMRGGRGRQPAPHRRRSAPPGAHLGCPSAWCL